MNLPFLRYFNFKKDKGAEGGVAVAPRPATPIEKPASDRFGKTVMPNVSRVVGVEQLRDFPMGNPTAAGSAAAPSIATSGPRKISLGGSGTIAVASKAESAGPIGERTIALQLADLAKHLPAGLLQASPIDPEKRVLFKASELERGMANGRPVVLLRAIFQQAPDFFVGDVEATDEREVTLPFGKVLEQFTAFQVRPDQVADESVPQVETPFLKMTIEDSARFGKAAAPIPAAAPATPAAPAAEAPAAEAPAAEAPAAPRALRLPLPNEPGAAAPEAPAPIRLETPPTAAALPANHISPNGMGVPATERVPASSGPSIPTPLPAPSAASAPMRIPFKISPPSNDLREPSTASRLKPAAVAFSAGGPRVRLRLRDVLRGLSPFQLSGPVDEVPETATIEIPFSIIEPQLSLGRIAVSPAQFQAALPEEYRSLFQIEETEAPVILPLQEVLQNLPNESLQLRGDQEEVEVAPGFETPFSTKAAEDAARLKVSNGPIARPVVQAAVSPAEPAVATGDAVSGPIPTEEKITKENVALPGSTPPASTTARAKKRAPAAVAQAPQTPLARSELQVAFDTDETLDAKTIVAQTSRLPGVSACAIVFSDGLSLAGNIPAEYQAEALCALAPTIVKRINDQMVGASLGPLNGITLYCAKTPVSFFAHRNICLAVLHSTVEITTEVRARLVCAVRELAQMYAQPA